MSGNEPKRGVLLSAEAQAALTLAHAAAAHRRAETLAQQGVPPDVAAERAYETTMAVMAWIFLVSPMMVLSCYATLVALVNNPFGVIVFGPEALLSIVLLFRVSNFYYAPADRDLKYRISTFAITVMYAVFTVVLFLLLFVSLMTQEP